MGGRRGGNSGRRRRSRSCCEPWGASCEQRGPIIAQALSQRLQLRFRRLQPEPHAHLAIHRRGSREVLVRLLAPAAVVVELAEAEVAVSDERAHTELLAEGERPLIALLRHRGSWLRRSCQRDLTQQAVRPRLVALLTVGPCELERAAGQGVCF